MSGQESAKPYTRLLVADRRAVVEILRDTNLEIDRAELNFVRDALVRPLNQIIESSAAELGWTFVSGINQDFRGHAICGEDLR